MNILLRSGDETMRAALGILAAERGWRLLPEEGEGSKAEEAKAEPADAAEEGFFPHCIFTDLDHCPPLYAGAPPAPDAPPEYTISFHEDKHPVLLRPFSEELLSAVLLSAENKVREKRAESAPADVAAVSASPMGSAAASGTAVLFFDGSAVYTAGKKITLSEKERQVFRILYEAHETPVSVRTIAGAVWNSEDAENSVRVYIRYLRKKLESVTDRKYIQTVRGGAFLLRRRSDG